MSERKAMDGALRAYLDALAAETAGALQPGMTDGEKAEVRRGLMVRALQSRESIPGLPNGVVMTEDVDARSGLRARRYMPAGEGGGAGWPVLVYFHGGGWVAGSTETHDPFCRLLSEAAEVAVVSVEYRLAPEHRYPAAVEDAMAAVAWARREAAGWGCDAGRVAVGGDSAGANLAAVAANRICAGGGAGDLRALMLLYPVTDHPSAGHRSYVENAKGCGLEADGMRWYWEQYAPGVLPGDAGASPLRAESLPALPPTLVATAEYDVLRDEGIAYADKMEEAGVAVTRMHAAEMHHDFPVSPGTVARFPQSREALREIGGWLRGAMGVGER